MVSNLRHPVLDYRSNLHHYDIVGSPKSSATPTASSFVRSVPEEEEEEAYPSAKILYHFDASSNFELGVPGKLLARPVRPQD